MAKPRIKLLNREIHEVLAVRKNTKIMTQKFRQKMLETKML